MGIKAASIARHWSLLLDGDGNLWKRHKSPSPFYSQVMLPATVTQVASNATAALILTNNGKLYSLGDDASRTGILGFNDIYSSSEPRVIPSFSTTSLIQVSIGKTHAAAIDSEIYLGLGVVYTWGSGTDGQLAQGPLCATQQAPTRIEASSMSVKQVVCGDTYTCTCTGGGYVYLYGRVGGHKAPKVEHAQASSASGVPYSVPELEQHFVLSIAGCLSCVVVLSDTGLAFMFDDCTELVRLPTASNVGVKAVVGCGDVILGLSGNVNSVDGHLYEWKEPHLQKSQTLLLKRLVVQGKTPCSLMAWSGRVHSLMPFYSEITLIGGAEGLGCGLVSAKEQPTSPIPLSKYLTEVNPYKRVQYAAKLLESGFDLSPRRSFILAKQTSLESINLYRSEDERSFTSIVQTRLLRERAVSLYSALQPIIQVRRKGVLLKLKEYSDSLMWYRKTIALMALPINLVKVLSRIELQAAAFGFSALKLCNLSSGWSFRFKSSVESLPHTVGELSMEELMTELRPYALKEDLLPSTYETSYSSEKQPDIAPIVDRCSLQVYEEAAALLGRVAFRSAFDRLKTARCLRSSLDQFMLTLQSIKHVSVVNDQSFADSVVIQETEGDRSDSSIEQLKVIPSLRSSPSRLLRASPISKGGSRIPSHSPILKIRNETLDSIRFTPAFSMTEDLTFKESFRSMLARKAQPSMIVNTRQRALDYSKQLSSRSKKSAPIATTNKREENHDSLNGTCLIPHCCLKKMTRQTIETKKPVRKYGISPASFAKYIKSKKQPGSIC